MKITVTYDSDGEIVRWRPRGATDHNPDLDDVEADLEDPAASLETKRVDVNADPPVLVDDRDAIEREHVRELAAVQRRHQQIQSEIDAGHIPSRSENANVDQVMTEWESRRDELRSQID